MTNSTSSASAPLSTSSTLAPLASDNSSARSPYRSEIDGLRAFAVIAVIINHFNKDLLPSGYLGVDIFFVISGYVITSSLANRAHKNLGDFLLGFYTRRIKRLVPALVICVVITSILICLFNPEPRNMLAVGWRSLFGLSNIELYKQSTDYFATSTELNVFTHTWSLGVEEQFYFLFPFLVWFTGFGRLTARGPRNLFWITGALSVASMITFVYLYQNNQLAAYFLMPARFWELGSGCLLFLGLKRSHRLLCAIGSIPPIAVTAAVFAVLFIPLQFAVQATVAIVGLTLILIACLRSETAVYDLFTHPRVVYIGLISYSLYLWHWSVLSISRWTIGIHWWSVPFQVALIFLLAVASYQYVEKPLRRAEWFVFRWQSIVFGMGASASAAIVLIGLGYPLQGKLFAGTNKKVDKKLSFSEVLSSNFDISEKASELAYKCNMTPNHLSGKDYRPQPQVDVKFLRACIRTSPDKKNKVMLVGDSFAHASAGHLAVIANRLGYDFKVVFGYGCPYPLPFAQIKLGASKKCSEVQEELLLSELLSGLENGDILVVRLNLPKGQYLIYQGGGHLPPVDAYDSSLRSLVNAASGKGAAIVLIGANPTLSVNHLTSITPQWFNSLNSSKSISPSDNPETSYFHLNDSHLRHFMGSMRRASYFSLEPYLCNRSEECYLRHGSKVLYDDNQHLTPYAYDLFYEDLYSRLKEFSVSQHK